MDRGSHASWHSPFALVTGLIATVALGGTMAQLLGESGLAWSVPISIAQAAAIASLAMLLWTQQAHSRRIGAALTELAHATERDSLTGLLNRVAFGDKLAELEAAKEGDVALLAINLDRFKTVIDRSGNRCGDLLLRTAAQRIVEVLPASSLIARVAGDEFAAVISADAPLPADEYATMLVEAIGQPFDLDGNSAQINASIGLAFGNFGYDTADDIRRRADLAMNEAKASCQGGARMFDDALADRLSAQIDIRTELVKSLDEGRFELYYQPLVSTRGGELVGVEALLRWPSSSMGNISPAIFIPVAEECGLIVKLTEWTIDAALTASRELGDIPININISPIYFADPNFASILADKLIARGVSPELMHVEITEGVLIESMEQAQRTIRQLRSIGVKVYLDDFGTGYSSLGYLQSFEFDGMKIDKSFLKHVGEGQQATQVMRSIIDLGHSLGLSVVVEGIETDWQARLSQLLNADVMQGYWLGTPMPLAELKEYRARMTTTADQSTDEDAVPEMLELPGRLAQLG